MPPMVFRNEISETFYSYFSEGSFLEVKNYFHYHLLVPVHRSNSTVPFEVSLLLPCSTYTATLLE